MPQNYLEEVPEHVDKTQEEWENLSYHGQYYLAEKRREKKRKRRKQRRHEKRDWLNEKKAEKGCKNCNEDDPVCLDFHHIDEKNFELGHAPNKDKSYEDMVKEIEKCVVICANCHRKLHADKLDGELV